MHDLQAGQFLMRLYDPDSTPATIPYEGSNLICSKANLRHKSKQCLRVLILQRSQKPPVVRQVSCVVAFAMFAICNESR